MVLVFTTTVLLAALFAILVIHIFPISIHYTGVGLSSLRSISADGNPLVSAVNVRNFPELFSQKGILPLILFSLLIGMATRWTGRASQAFTHFLSSGNAVMKSVLRFLMLLAPIGLGTYFGCQLASSGAQLINDYTQILVTAHLIALLYFVLAFTGYSSFAGGVSSARYYWRYNLAPSLTALATCSSVATLPSNLEAAGKMGIPSSISEICIPLGTILHKEGSAIVTVVGLSLVGNGFGHLDACLTALLIAVLVSVIEGSIPNGGYTGQLLIMSVYHFPAAVWPVIIIISTLLDPVATLLNVGGNTASALLINRFLRTRPTSVTNISR
jgi:Na+/H+-dicarboxylate symporter